MEKITLKQLLEKINRLKQTGEIDLSLDEDLSIAVMNLISLEEHFYFTAQKTGKDDYLELLNQTREIRKVLLKKMVAVHEGETWCISKHLLATTMRLIEVGTKLYSSNRQGEAKEMFNHAYQIYSIFWALRLKLIDTAEIKKWGRSKMKPAIRKSPGPKKMS
jgi:hypothetical protein